MYGVTGAFRILHSVYKAESAIESMKLSRAVEIFKLTFHEAEGRIILTTREGDG